MMMMIKFAADAAVNGYYKGTDGDYDGGDDDAATAADDHDD